MNPVEKGFAFWAILLLVLLLLLACEAALIVFLIDGNYYRRGTLNGNGALQGRK